jgi:HK97 family phage portal protein
MSKRKQRPKKNPPQAQVKTWPNWMPVGGSHFSSGVDAFGRGQPNANDLIGAFTDTVYAAASLIADTVASTPIKLFVKTDPGQPKPKCPTRPASFKTLQDLTSRKMILHGARVEEVCHHPALDLLNKCNAYHNRLDLICLTELYLEITGNAFWLCQFDPYGVPTEVYLLPTQLVTPERNDKGQVVGWRFGQGYDSVVYPTKDIIHFKFPSLEDPYGMGYSPLQAAWNRVQIQCKEMGYLDATLTNFGRPDAILSPNEPISPFEAERTAKEFIHRFRGQGNGGVFVADGPMTVTPISWPAKDFAELQVYQTIKNAVSNAFHIPPDIWEMGEANRATADAILYALALHCIKPRMTRLVEKLNERLLPMFDGGQGRLFFEAEHIVPADKDYELREADFLAKYGIVTRNEFRERFGYAPAEWADEPLLPPGMMPAILDEPGQEVPITPEPVDRSAQAPALAQLQQAVYAGQLPREAAIANVQFTFGFGPEEAAALFPDIAPQPYTTEPTDERTATDGPSPSPQPQGDQGDDKQPVKGCPTCDGTGDLGRNVHERQWDACPDCKGSGERTKALDVPDVRQSYPYDCGAAATMAVCQFYGVGPATEEEYIAALGTTEEEGTDPQAIISYLQQVGLRVDARNDLEVYDLATAGCPVIVCVQDYEEEPEDIPEEASGHYVVVCGADDDNITLQDPVNGRVEMPTTDFLARWEDRSDTQDFVHFGIFVFGPDRSNDGKGNDKGDGNGNDTDNGHAPGKGKARTKTVRKKSPRPLVEALQRFFNKQKEAVLQHVKGLDELTVKAVHGWLDIGLDELTVKAGPVHGWLDIEHWNKVFADEMLPTLALYYDDAAKATAARLGGARDLWAVVQPNLKEAVRQQTFTFADSTNQTTSLEIGRAIEVLKKEMTEGLEAGEYKNLLAHRVQKVFEQAGVERAYLIGHTEANRAQHAAMELTAIQSGVATGKRWILSDDACPLCLPLAGKVVALGENFATLATGGPYAEIPYPPLHPACRCTMIEVVEGVND